MDPGEFVRELLDQAPYCVIRETCTFDEMAYPVFHREVLNEDAFLAHLESGREALEYARMLREKEHWLREWHDAPRPPVTP